MKRILSILLVVLLFSAPAFAESLDLSSMSYEQLAELKQAVDNEYYMRPEAEPKILAPGEYVVGRDIQAGIYYVCVNSYEFNKDASARFKAYKSQEDYAAGGDLLWCEWPALNKPSISVTLNDGNLLRVDYFPITLSVKELTEEQRYKYTAPEGTYVPCGIYKVGQDIPAGSYQVYMGSLDGGDVYVYADDSAYSEKNYESHVELKVIWTEHVKPLSVSDGNVVVVKSDVVMKKQAALVFD